MAEIKDLHMTILVIISVGMLLGVGILVFDQFGVAVKTEATIVNESITITNLAGATANDDIVSVSYFGNSTWNCAPIDTGCVNVTTGGVVTTNSTFNNATFDISYVYDADSTGTTTMTNMISASSPIASTWLPLIVTVLVLAIILGMVIRSFSQQRR